MARSFNGTTDYISTGQAGPSATCPITISAWAQTASFTNGTMYTIAQFGVDNNISLNYRLNFLGKGASTVAMEADCRSTSADEVADTSTTASINTWVHGCAYFLNSGGHVQPNVLINGGGLVSGGTTHNISVASVKGVAIAALDLLGTGQFNFGVTRVADVGVWNVQLSAGEISALAAGARPYTIRPSALIAYQPLGLSSPEVDLSGNKNNGTVHGTSVVADPSIMMFTPRWPQFTTLSTPSTAVFRRSLSALGTRIGSRQAQG